VLAGRRFALGLGVGGEPGPVGFSSASRGQTIRLKTRAESRRVVLSPASDGAESPVASHTSAGQSWVTTWNCSTS
jgi:hypothetical protein